MNVKQLIAKLKKMPQDAAVCGRDHDHGDDETNGRIMTVQLVATEDLCAASAPDAEGAEFVVVVQSCG